MSKAEAILARLDASGIQLLPDGDNLRLRGPAEAITPELKASIRENKPALLALLRIDTDGDYHAIDGTVYSPTDTGGWILTQHPTRKVVAPGLLAVDGVSSHAASPLARSSASSTRIVAPVTADFSKHGPCKTMNAGIK